jgi:hypothetical protein
MVVMMVMLMRMIVRVHLGVERERVEQGLLVPVEDKRDRIKTSKTVFFNCSGAQESIPPVPVPSGPAGTTTLFVLGS